MNLIAEFAAYAVGLIGDIFKRPNPVSKIVIPILPEAIARIALTQVGIRETSRNQGDGIAKFWEATDYPEGYKNREPYCAAAGCWIVREAMNHLGIKETPGFKRPTTASAFGFESWSLAQDSTTSTKKKPRGDIKRGDLIVFSFSHFGIALGHPDKNGHFLTVELNTGAGGGRDGDGGYEKTRHIDLVRSRIRFTI